MCAAKVTDPPPANSHTMHSWFAEKERFVRKTSLFTQNQKKSLQQVQKNGFFILQFQQCAIQPEVSILTWSQDPGNSTARNTVRWTLRLMD